MTIDIKTGTHPNSINCRNENGVITVEILTTEALDAMLVDHSPLTFKGAGETRVDKKCGEPNRLGEDVNGDGDLDLVFRL